MRIPGTLTRSAGVGVVASVLDLLLLWVFVDLVGLAPAVANLPALLAGLVAQFAGNKWLAFRDRSPNLARQGAQFAIVEAGALGLNAVGFHLMVTLMHVPYLPARILVSTVVYFGWSYGLWARIFDRGPVWGRQAPAERGRTD
jgi:putative flippase GtrA